MDFPKERQSRFPRNGNRASQRRGKHAFQGMAITLSEERQMDFPGNGNKSAGKQVLFHLKTRAFDTVLLREKIQRGGDLNN